MGVTVYSVLNFASLASAHFLLNYPPSVGFDEDTEGQSPCGGAKVVFGGNDVDVQVGGFPLQLRSTHPQAQWLFRGTLDQVAPYNWTNLLPVVNEIGLGDFCLPALEAPSAWAGKQGLIQVVQDAADGELYQCAAVNFASGTNTSVSGSCQNVTGLTATITTQQDFGGSSTTPSPSPTGSPSAAEALAAPLGISGVVLGLIAFLGLL